MKKKKKKALSNIFLWTFPADQWCNMLQTLEIRRKYIGIILSAEHTLRQKWPIKHFLFLNLLFSRILNLKSKVP